MLLKSTTLTIQSCFQQDPTKASQNLLKTVYFNFILPTTFYFFPFSEIIKTIIHNHHQPQFTIPHHFHNL